METKEITYLAGTACDDFEEWAEASNIGWIEDVGSDPDWIVYCVEKEDVLSCTKVSPYLIELQQAFKKHPQFDAITLHPEECL
jgi:hypothetical protein